MIYLASPWFNDHEKQMYKLMLNKMRSNGLEVYAPIEHEIPNAWDISNKDWGKAVFEEDIKALNKSDEVWVLNFGMYSDSGTAWECGYAYAMNKSIKMFIDDWSTGVYSLMMINGCKELYSMLNYISNTDYKINIEVK
jgi:nucleoside 2-deoxyribosyltransferase